MDKSKIILELEEGMKLQLEVTNSWENQGAVKEDPPGFSNQSRDFGEAVQVIRPLVDKVLQPLKSLSETPDKIELEFGFCFTKNSELLLKEGQKEAHIQVRLSFNQPKD